MSKKFNFIKSSLMGSSTLPAGQAYGLFAPSHSGHHHHHHHADGSCCDHDHSHDHAHDDSVESGDCGHNHAPGEKCGG